MEGKEGKEIHDLPSEQPADKGYTGADFDDPNNIRPTPRGPRTFPDPQRDTTPSGPLRPTPAPKGSVT